MPISVTCGKCGKTIETMTMLKPIKDIMKRHGGRCPSCGQALLSEFSLEDGGR